MWLKFWPHADLKHREVECLAWLSVVQASPGAVHCCIACATSCERQPCKMMKDISDKYPSLCIPLRGVEESSKGSLPPFKSCRILPSSDAVISHKRRLPIIGNSSQKSLPLFKFSMPFSPAIQIVCTDHWSARNWWWTPKHCTSTSRHSVTCILGNQEPFRMIQGDWSLGVLLARTLDDTRRHPSTRFAISWCSCLSLQIRWNSGHSCIAALKGVTILQRQRSSGRWTYQCPNNAATASSHRNGKTQPTQRLGCITGVLFMPFSICNTAWKQH